MIGEHDVLRRLAAVDRVAPDRMGWSGGYSLLGVYLALGGLYSGALGETARGLRQWLGSRLATADLRLLQELARDGHLWTRVCLTHPGPVDPLYRTTLGELWSWRSGTSLSLEVRTRYTPCLRYTPFREGERWTAQSPGARYTLLRPGTSPLEGLELYTTHPDYRVGWVWTATGPAPRPERALLRELTDNLLPVSELHYSLPPLLLHTQDRLDEILDAEGVSVDGVAVLGGGPLPITLVTDLSYAGEGCRSTPRPDPGQLLTVPETCTWYLRHWPTDLCLLQAHLGGRGPGGMRA